MVALSNTDTTLKFSDEELVALFLKNKDKHYFEAIYERYERKVYGRCMIILKDSEEAQDVMQEVFVKVYFKLDGFRGDAKFGTWIHRVTTNSCLNWINKKSYSSEVVIDEEIEDLIMHTTEDPLKKLLESSQKELIKNTLEALDHNDTIMILMKYADGISMIEIAEQFGIKEGAMKVRLFRARKKFVETFTELEQGNSLNKNEKTKKKKEETVTTQKKSDTKLSPYTRIQYGIC